MINAVNSKYSNYGGYGMFCGKKCAQAKADAGILPKGDIVGEDDLILAQAMLEAQRQPDNSWTAMQTAGVVIASLIGITLLVVVIKKVKK